VLVRFQLFDKAKYDLNDTIARLYLHENFLAQLSGLHSMNVPLTTPTHERKNDRDTCKIVGDLLDGSRHDRTKVG